MRGGFKIFEQAGHIWQVVPQVAGPTLRPAMQALIAIWGLLWPLAGIGL